MAGSSNWRMGKFRPSPGLGQGLAVSRWHMEVSFTLGAKELLTFWQRETRQPLASSVGLGSVYWSPQSSPPADGSLVAPRTPSPIPVLAPRVSVSCLHILEPDTFWKTRVEKLAGQTFSWLPFFHYQIFFWTNGALCEVETAQMHQVQIKQ